MSKVMFLGSFKFKSKTTNKESYGYKFVEFSEVKGVKSARDQTLFTNDAIDVSELIPGDIVKVDFDEPSSLGGKPTIIDITKLEDSTMY